MSPPDETVGRLGEVFLLARPSSEQLARGYVRAQLLMAEIQVPEDIELLTGELVANAIKHSDSRRNMETLQLRVLNDEKFIRVSVTDAGSSHNIPQIPSQADLLAESGRGLWLVKELSDDWGWWDEEETGRRVVWFKMAIPDAPDPPAEGVQISSS